MIYLCDFAEAQSLHHYMIHNIMSVVTLTSSKPSTCIHVIFSEKNVYFYGPFSLVCVWNGPRTEFMHLFYVWLRSGLKVVFLVAKLASDNV